MNNNLTPRQLFLVDRIRDFTFNLVRKPRDVFHEATVVSLFPHSGFFLCEEINMFVDLQYAVYVKEILEELSDPSHEGYRHGHRGTRNRGCRGPLCAYALRAWQADRARINAIQEGRKLKEYKRSERAEAEDQIACVFVALYEPSSSR